MKLVYLISAYKDPIHLKRLISSLNEGAVSFYIHVDKKVDINNFTSIIQSKNIFFIRKRYNISWGTYSQVRSIFALIKAILANNDSNIDRVVLISAQDYPIMSNSEIIETFIKNPLKQYLIGYNVTHGITEQQNKINCYHFLEIKNLLIRKYITKIVNKTLQKKTQVLLNNRYVDVYTGSDYWALTYDCVDYIYKTYKKEHRLRNYFRFSFVPSESIVHTIVFNSEYKSNVEICEPQHYKGLYTCTPLHYIQYREHIKIFKLEDYDELANSGKMFFRKASSEESSDLLEKIDLDRAVQINITK